MPNADEEWVFGGAVIGLGRGVVKTLLNQFSTVVCIKFLSTVDVVGFSPERFLFGVRGVNKNFLDGKFVHLSP